MKTNLFFIYLLGFSLTVHSCVSQRPQIESMLDGIRCPAPAQATAFNTMQPKRAPAAITSNSKVQSCDQLFVK